MREDGTATFNASRGPFGVSSATATEDTPASLSSELVAYPRLRTVASWRCSYLRLVMLLGVRPSSRSVGYSASTSWSVSPDSRAFPVEVELAGIA